MIYPIPVRVGGADRIRVGTALTPAIKWRRVLTATSPPAAACPTSAHDGKWTGASPGIQGDGRTITVANRFDDV